MKCVSSENINNFFIFHYYGSKQVTITHTQIPTKTFCLVITVCSILWKKFGTFYQIKSRQIFHFNADIEVVW